MVASIGPEVEGFLPVFTVPFARLGDFSASLLSYRRELETMTL